jgi:hypothetical protein
MAKVVFAWLTGVTKNLLRLSLAFSSRFTLHPLLSPLLWHGVGEEPHQNSYTSTSSHSGLSCLGEKFLISESGLLWLNFAPVSY